MKGKKIYCLIFLLILLSGLNSLTGLAQSNEAPKDIFLEAESYFLYEEFNEALPLYQKLKDQLSENYNLDYRIGCCYLNIPYESKKSVSFLETAVKHISMQHKEASLKENNAPLDAWFFLGDAYRINNQLDKAVDAYQKFKKLVTEKDYDISLIDHQIEACQRARKMQLKPVDIDEANMGDVINTRYSETNPVVSADETMLVYAAKLPFYQAMFYSKKVNGKWTAPVNMLPELGVDGDCFPTSISSDGKELYIYRSDEFKGDLYVSNYRDGKWTKLRKLNDYINTKYWESHACISPDGRSLYFTSNRPGGYGQLDIYRSMRASVMDDNWGAPVNLGSTINTRFHEDAPFLALDGWRLYFSSFGHESMGGFDIFYSDLVSGTWRKPVNLGYPINTPYDEIFFNPGNNATFGYVAKVDRDGFGRHDIVKQVIFNPSNPRKYLIMGRFEEVGINGLAVYDELKRDTVFYKTLKPGEFSFETTFGNYSLIFMENGSPVKVVSLKIPEGSKNVERNIGEVSVQKQIASIETVLADVGAKTVSEVKVQDANLALTKPEETSKKSADIGVKADVRQVSATIKAAPDKPLLIQDKTAALSEKSLNPSIFVSAGLVVFLVFILIFVKRRKRDK